MAGQAASEKRSGGIRSGDYWGQGALAVAFLCLALAAPAWAAQWQRTFTPSGPAVLNLNTSEGGVVVTAWDQNQVQVTVQTRGWSIGPGGVQVQASQAGGTVAVRVRAPRQQFAWGDHDIHITVQAPRRTQLHIRTGDGDLRVAGLRGPLWLKTGDGDIRGSDLQTPSLVARTGDGNIRMAGQFAAIEAGTGDGDIHLNAAPGSRVSTAWMLRSGDGNLTVAVPADLAAEVDARTSDGAIHLHAPVQVSGPADGHHLHGQLHGGGGLIALRSGDGTITLATD